MSRVTKAMKAPRRKPVWRRPRKRVTHLGPRTVVYGSGRIYINGVPLGNITDVSFDFGTSFQELPMTFEPVKTQPAR